MRDNNYDEVLELAVIKIQAQVKVRYDDALMLGKCIAYAYFEIEGDAAILAEKFNLSEVDLAALTRDTEFYNKKVEEDLENRFLAYYGE